MNKKKKILVIVGIIALIVAIGFVIYIIMSNNVKKTNKTINSLEIKELLKEDQKLKTIVYGNLKLADASVKIDEMEYFLFEDKEITSMSVFTQKMNDIYDQNIINQLSNDMHVYNEMVEVSKSLYINPNPKCDIPKYIDDVKIKKTNSKSVIIEYQKNEYTIDIVNGKYKLNETPFTCGNLS
jgi:hypothetical protein